MHHEQVLRGQKKVAKQFEFLEILVMTHENSLIVKCYSFTTKKC